MEDDLFQFLNGPQAVQQGDDDPRDGDICMDFYDQPVGSDSTVVGQPFVGLPVGQPEGCRFNSSISNTYDSGLGSVLSPVYAEENQVIAGSINIQNKNKKAMPARLSQGLSPSTGQGNLFSPSSPYQKHAPYDISKRGRRDSKEVQESGPKIIQANGTHKPQLFAQSVSQPQPLFDISLGTDFGLSRRARLGDHFVSNPIFSSTSTHVLSQQHDVRTVADESPRMSKCRPETNDVLKERLGVVGRTDEDVSKFSPAKSPNLKQEVKTELSEEEERKRRQQEKNRKYAKESRDRKNEKLKKLEMENKQLESALEITRKALSLVYTKQKGPETGWQEYKIVWYPGGKYQDSVEVTCVLPADEELLREIGNSSIGAVVHREVTPATELKNLKRVYPPFLSGNSVNEHENLANLPTFLEQGQVLLQVRGLGSAEQTQTMPQVAELGSPVCGMELSTDSRSGEPPRYLPQTRPSDSPESQGITSPTRRLSSEIIQTPDKTNGSPVKQPVPQEFPTNILNQSQPTFTSGGQLPQPTFTSGGQLPHPTFTSGGKLPQPTFTSGGKLPQPTFTSGGQLPQPTFTSGGQLPQPTFTSGGQLPQPTFTSGGQIPQPTFTSGGKLPQPTFTSGGQHPHKPEEDPYCFDAFNENEEFESPWSTRCPDNNNNSNNNSNNSSNNSSNNNSNNNQTALPDIRDTDRQLPLQPPGDLIAGPDFSEICNLSSMDLADVFTEFSCEKDS